VRPLWRLPGVFVTGFNPRRLTTPVSRDERLGLPVQWDSGDEPSECHTIAIPVPVDAVPDYRQSDTTPGHTECGAEPDAGEILMAGSGRLEVGGWKWEVGSG
jgi:hypothetical protein